MSAATPPALSGLARLLVQHKKLIEADAIALQLQANTAKVPFVQELAASKKISDLHLAQFAAHTFGLPFFELSSLEHSYVPGKTFDAKLMQGQRIAPLFKRGNRLFVAISDPTNLQALDDAKFQTSMAIEPIVVEDGKLGKFINHLMDESGANLNNMSAEDIDLNLEGGGDPAEADTGMSVSEVEDAPIVKYLQKILLDAINTGASDIHFEP